MLPAVHSRDPLRRLACACCRNNASALTVCDEVTVLSGFVSGLIVVVLIGAINSAIARAGRGPTGSNSNPAGTDGINGTAGDSGALTAMLSRAVCSGLLSA